MKETHSNPDFTLEENETIVNFYDEAVAHLDWTFEQVVAKLLPDGWPKSDNLAELQAECKRSYDFAR